MVPSQSDAGQGASNPPTRLLPGLLLCVAVTAIATLLQAIEVRLVGEPYLEGLMLAIIGLIGFGLIRLVGIA